MYHNILTSIICDTFRKRVGTWGGNVPGEMKDIRKVLVVSFCVSFDYEQEQGHRFLRCMRSRSIWQRVVD